MAALAGCGIHNALIEIDGPEVPGCDGSAREFCERLLDAGIDQQSAPARIAAVFAPWSTIDRDAGCEVAVRPHIRPLQAITYQLDYGPRSPIRAQRLTIELTPEVFLRDICWARTFVLEAEVRQLRAAGFGSRVTERDLLVFGPDGVVGNTLRSADECARHKILDSIGDLALSGHQIHGHFMAWRSGHRHNHEVVRALPQFALPLEPHRSAA